MVTDQVRNELLDLQATSPDNMLHVQRAVDWAKQNPGSALHERLDWDDSNAANSWRCEQVRRLIRYHVVTEVGEPEVISLKVDRVNGGGYRDINEVRETMADILLREAIRALVLVRKRYGNIQKLQDVWEEIDRAVATPAPRTRPATRDRTTRSRPAIGA